MRKHEHDLTKEEWVALEVLKTMVPAMRLRHVQGVTSETDAQAMREAVAIAKVAAKELLAPSPRSNGAGRMKHVA